MTTVDADPHVAAILDMLTTGLPPTVTVYDGDVPSRPDQAYVVLYPDPGWRERSSLAVVSDHLTLSFQVTCVGTTAVQTRQVCDQVCGALIDRAPVVTGRQCTPISQDQGMPDIARDSQTRDPAIGRPRFWLTPRFRFTSTS